MEASKFAITAWKALDWFEAIILLEETGIWEFRGMIPFIWFITVWTLDAYRETTAVTPLGSPVLNAVLKADKFTETIPAFEETFWELELGALDAGTIVGLIVG